MPSHPSGPFAAFRIAENRFPLLDGGGAYRFGGRWNSAGRHVIYAGIGFAVALIEKLVRSRLGKVPKNHHFGEIFIPAAIAVEEVGPVDVPGWERPDYVASQAYGDAWYDSSRTAVLIVPSLPAVGLERNVLINQRHPEFRHVTHANPRPVVWDARLFAAS
jgi:RES domain-containing protein